METPRWERLSTIQDWARQLEALLLAAESAVREGTSADRLAVQRLLTEFVKASPARCAFLDRIASAASHDVLLHEVQAALKGIEARNAELRRAASLIEDVTREARSDARAIGFLNAIEVLDRAKLAMDALEAAEKALNAPDGKVLEGITALKAALAPLVARLKADVAEDPGEERGP